MRYSRTAILSSFLLMLFSLQTAHSQWVTVSLPYNRSQVQALSVNGSTIFAGTGLGGVFRSTDYGSSWTKVYAGASNGVIWSLATVGTDVLAGIDGGIFRSTDNGDTWSQVSNGAPTVSVSVLAVNGPVVLAGTLGLGIYRSIDSGETWTQAGLATSNIRSILIDGTTVFAGTDYEGINRSTDNGNHWTPVGLTNLYAWSLAKVGGTILAGTSAGLYWSSNSGGNWVQSSIIKGGWVESLLQRGNIVFAGVLGGLFRSPDGNDNWSQIGAGLVNGNIYSLATVGNVLFVGTVDGGVYRRPMTDFLVLAVPRNKAGGVTMPSLFKWNKNPQALTYSFQVATASTFGNCIVNDYTSDTAYTVSNLQPSTPYFWRVRAENASWVSEWEVASFTTKMMSPPQLTSPASGTALVSVTPTMSWSSVVSTATYTLQISPRMAFDLVIYSKDTMSTNIISPELQRVTTYYWRVRAQTPGDTTKWSSVSSFTTPPFAPNGIWLVYPDSNKQNAYQNDWLTWQAEPAATSYLVQISQSPLFASVFDSATVKSAGYRNANKVFTSGSMYFWRVRGSNTGGDGPFSSIWSFRVGSAFRMPATLYSSSKLDYGRVKVGQSRDTVVTISNNGNDTLKINSISSSVSAFSARPTVRTVPPGQSFGDTIRFVPTVIGMGTSSVIIGSNSSTGSDTIKVSGFGFGQGVASISSSNIAIGRMKIGQFKDTTIIIANTGNDTLKMTNIGSSDVVFSVRTTNKTLPPGQSFIDTIRFAPTRIGITNAVVVVSSNSTSSPDTVRVSGFGYGEATVSLSTSVISFGTVKVWQYRDTLVTILNKGNDTLKIQNIYVPGGMFSARPLSGFVPPGKSLNDTIRFLPSTYGNMQATIVVISNSQTTRDTIKVSGVGLAAALKFNVVQVDFGLVLLGKSKDTAVTALNQGNDTLRITSITCKHPAIISTNTSLMIPPGGSAIDTFRFVPQTVGPVLGTMLFVNNGLGTYDTLRVIGSGVTATTGIVQDEIPTVFGLKQNYPNPFNPSTIISYSLPKTANVSLRIFNTLGQEIALLVNERKETGYYQATWNANVPSGIYFYRLQAGEFVATKKMILLR